MIKNSRSYSRHACNTNQYECVYIDTYQGGIIRNPIRTDRTTVPTCYYQSNRVTPLPRNPETRVRRVKVVKYFYGRRYKKTHTHTRARSRVFILIYMTCVNRKNVFDPVSPVTRLSRLFELQNERHGNSTAVPSRAYIRVKPIGARKPRRATRCGGSVADVKSNLAGA